MKDISAGGTQTTLGHSMFDPSCIPCGGSAFSNLKQSIIGHYRGERCKMARTCRDLQIARICACVLEGREMAL